MDLTYHEKMSFLNYKMHKTRHTQCGLVSVLQQETVFRKLIGIEGSFSVSHIPHCRETRCEQKSAAKSVNKLPS